MKYRFGNDNLITGYIKNLLHEFNLPQAKVITSDDMPRYENKFYIKDRKIYYGKSKEQHGVYSYGEKIPNFTKNYIINSSVYDSYTHTYLGDFLRFIRDYKQLDLMPLYNCFNNEVPYSLKFTLDVPYKVIEGEGSEAKEVEHTLYFRVDTSSELYNYYIFPIKFDAKYNIAIESMAPYEICAMIYTGSHRTKLCNQLMKKTYTLIGNSSFSNPYTFMVEGNDKEQPKGDNQRFTDFEENLRLLIKIPKSVKTSIVIIEGDIVTAKMYGDKIPSKVVYNEEPSITFEDNSYTRPTYSDLVPSTNLSLLSLNDGVSYPFADRLVEYLLRGAINNTEKLQYNVARVQQKVYPKLGDFKGFYDVWNIDLNYRINEFMNTKIKNNSAIISELDKTIPYKDYTDSDKPLVDYSKFTIRDTYKDLLGYADKDIEYHLEAL